MKYEAYNGEQTCGHRHGTEESAEKCGHEKWFMRGIGCEKIWKVREIPRKKSGRPSTGLTARLPQIAVDVETLTAFEKLAQADGTTVAEIRRAAYKEYLTRAIGLK